MYEIHPLPHADKDGTCIAESVPVCIFILSHSGASALLHTVPPRMDLSAEVDSHGQKAGMTLFISSGGAVPPLCLVRNGQNSAGKHEKPSP